MGNKQIQITPEQQLQIKKKMEQTVNLQPHQQRVVEEYKELKDKTTKLGAFILDNPIYLSLDKVEQEDMKKQYDAMCIYCDALESRIKRF